MDSGSNVNGSPTSPVTFDSLLLYLKGVLRQALYIIVGRVASLRRRYPINYAVCGESVPPLCDQSFPAYLSRHFESRNNDLVGLSPYCGCH